MALSQADRRIGVSSPLGEDVLLLRRMTGKEELGRLFQYDLELLSEDGAINLDDILGQVMTVRLSIGDETQRFWSGHVASFRQVGTHGDMHRYEAVLRPWLWFLTRTSDCRILPDKASDKTLNAPGIVKAIFGEHGFSDIEDGLEGSYKPWEHCVQYRETDFNFVSRLLEQEGIYYYFKHEDGKHTLVLADAHSSHETISGYEEVPFFPPENDDVRERDHLNQWTLSRNLQPGVYATRDFDFMRPKANLEFKSSVSRDHVQAKLEMYDYPGDFVEPADGDLDAKSGNDDLKEAYEKTAKCRIEEYQARFERVDAAGNAAGLGAGALFKLTDHPREDQNREYLIVSASYELISDEFGSDGSAGKAPVYSCRIGAIDAKTPFRPARSTPKPSIQGPQTAIVAGPDGEEVHTDQYGRVRVHFHWDRYSDGKETSSCWVRVSQNWAGSSWGGMHLPHVGQEVIVEFLEGDPDRPIVTGRVYNEDNMPPLELPTHKDKSIISDNYGNMLLFNGEKGKEHISLYSPHHGSKLTLGQSKKEVTRSNSESYTYGDTHSLHVGDRYSTTNGQVISKVFGNYCALKRGQIMSYAQGASYSLFAGISASVAVGCLISVTAAWKFSATLAREYKYTKGDYTRTSGSDVVLDSDQAVILSGGENDKTMLYSDDHKLVLSHGAAAKRDKASWRDHAGKIAAAVSAAAIGTAAWFEAANTGWQNADAFIDKAKKEERVDSAGAQIPIKREEEELKELMDGDWSKAKTYMLPVAALVGGIAGSLGKSVDKPMHDSKTALVQIAENFVDVWAGSDKNALIIDGDAKTITLKAETKIIIEAPDIEIKAGTKVLIDTPLAEYTGEFKNANTDSK